MAIKGLTSEPGDNNTNLFQKFTLHNLLQFCTIIKAHIQGATETNQQFTATADGFRIRTAA